MGRARSLLGAWALLLVLQSAGATVGAPADASRAVKKNTGFARAGVQCYEFGLEPRPMRPVPLPELLSMYEEGLINKLDFMTLMLGLLHEHPPEELFAKTFPILQPYFMYSAEHYVRYVRESLREGNPVYNCLTDEPLPDEAVRRFVEWFDSQSPA